MRPGACLLPLAGAAFLAACTGTQDDPVERVPAPVVEIVFGGGDDREVGTAPVRAVVPADATVRLQHRGAGRSTTHLLTSASPGAGPQVFTRVSTGVLPNAAVWGPCLGGVAEAATSTCPVVPVEAPRRWDGRAYASLGAQLPEEVRELRLDLEPGQEASLWCRLHPGLRIDLVAGDVAPSAPEEPADPEPPDPEPPDPEPPVPPGARSVPVTVAPASPEAELLAFVPSTVRLPVGGEVVWTVPGAAPHSVEVGRAPSLEDSGPADAVPLVPPGGEVEGARSGILSTDPGALGSTFRLAFPQAGRYRYACRFHPQMTGEVVVG